MKALILPPLTRFAKDAEAFARVVHEGQVDKAGRPYVEHLERVADRVNRFLWENGHTMASPLFMDAMQIAWLHDVIEDTDYTAMDLAQEGFTDPVLEAVEWLTRDGRSCRRYPRYQDWIGWLADYGSPAARIVKLADVEDNSDPERLALLDEATRARLERKYEPARERLQAAIAERR